jgi:hypothetical protein
MIHWDPDSMSRQLKPGFRDMGYDDRRSLQISADGKRVLKMSARLHAELQTQRLFELLAPRYAANNTHFVTLRGEGALEMDYAGECIGDVMFQLSENEFALCMLQSVEMLLLVGNALRIEDFHPGNVCFRNRGPSLQLRFIDTEHWERMPAVYRDDPDSILEANARLVLFNFWENVATPSKNTRVQELKYNVFVRDEASDILTRLYVFACSLFDMIVADDHKYVHRVGELIGRIDDLYYYHLALRRVKT